MVCTFCDEFSAVAILDQDSAYLLDLLQNVWKQHLSIKEDFLTKYRKKCQEYESLDNKFEILRATITYQKEKDFTPEKNFNEFSQTQDNLGDNKGDTTPEINFDESPITQDNSGDSEGANKTPEIIFNEESQNILKDIEWNKIFKTANDLNLNEENSPNGPLQRERNNKDIQHTMETETKSKSKIVSSRMLNFESNRTNAGETFCKDFLNATPENREKSSRILNHMRKSSRMFNRMRESSKILNRCHSTMQRPTIPHNTMSLQQIQKKIPKKS